ncbi:hypothetical protein [Aeromonas caviae]|uniref:hypothetical protein n=1 Tax=Aeromonas caviae TaxID=648 RepID=UPI001CC635A6|nr:hypothetical protein [Aeromonas caviae]GJA47248.1 hypothetical protein KAM346_35370 [Aeromonas caviae]
MNKKERAAPQNATTPTTPSPGHATTKATKVPTLLELAAVHLLESGMKGTSQLTFFPLYHDFNYRNRIDELRNDHDVIIHSMPFDHRNSAGRTITAVADTEAQARAALAGLPLVFVSRRPTGRAAA